LLHDRQSSDVRLLSPAFVMSAINFFSVSAKAITSLSGAMMQAVEPSLAMLMQARWLGLG